MVAISVLEERLGKEPKVYALDIFPETTDAAKDAVLTYILEQRLVNEGADYRSEDYEDLPDGSTQLTTRDAIYTFHYTEVVGAAVVAPLEIEHLRQRSEELEQELGAVRGDLLMARSALLDEPEPFPPVWPGPTGHKRTVIAGALDMGVVRHLDQVAQEEKLSRQVLVNKAVLEYLQRRSPEPYAVDARGHWVPPMAEEETDERDLYNNE